MSRLVEVRLTRGRVVIGTLDCGHRTAVTLERGETVDDVNQRGIYCGACRRALTRRLNQRAEAVVS